MKYARLEGNYVAQVMTNDPHNVYSPWYADQFVECPDWVDVGYLWNGETYYLPPPPPPTLVQLHNAMFEFLQLKAETERYNWISAYTQVHGWPTDIAAWQATVASINWPGGLVMPPLPE